MGGLEKFPYQWEKEAQYDQIPELYIEKISGILRNYSNPDPAFRENAINEIRQIINQIAKVLESDGSVTNLNNLRNDRVPHDDVHMELLDGDLGKRYHLLGTTQSDSITEKALNSPITVMKGIGPVNSKKFEALGIRNINDLLYYFPRRYDDFSQLKTINRLVIE